MEKQSLNINKELLQSFRFAAVSLSGSLFGNSADQGLKLSFRLTARLKTGCSGVLSRLSAQK